MGGLFDGEETGGTPSGDHVPVKDGALFPAETSSHGASQVLFPDEATPLALQAADLLTGLRPTGQPAFPQTVSVIALPLDEMPVPGANHTADQRNPFVGVPVGARLLLNDTPTVPQATPKPVIGPATIASDVAPVQQRKVVASVQPQEIFEEPEDPLIHKALQHAKEKYPDGFEHRRRMLKARFETLLPLDFDRISEFSAGTLPHVQVVLREVSQSSHNLSAISVSTAVQEITTAARDAAGGSAPSHGLGGLLKRMEQSVKHFDPDAAQNTLMRLYGGVKSIHARLSGIGELAQETLTALQADVMVMSVIAYMAENTQFAQQSQRRHELLLITGQELQLAQKQLEALRAQTENALMQIEEVRTVTLPSLGFLGAIR